MTFSRSKSEKPVVRSHLKPALSILSDMLVALGGSRLPSVDEPAALLGCFSQVSRLDSVGLFAVDHLRSSFLSKWEHLQLGIDTRAVALLAFEESEVKCRNTNKLWEDGIPDLDRDLLRKARDVVYRVLGSEPPDLRDLPLHLGPGATYNVGRSKDHGLKLDPKSGNDATLQLLRHTNVLESLPHVTGVNIVPGSRLTTVPKSYKTDRVICIEPTLNGMVQRAYGKRIRRRLLDILGLDIRTQADFNRGMISSGFGVEKYATVDFRAASDTISFQVVRHLLPWKWFEALAASACPRYEIDGEWREFEKFSSMGCGFTFELETLIFASICVAAGCIPGEFSVFGDDVIVRRELAGVVKRLGEHMGFETNVDKTFVDGPFRESCGYDSFKGICVSPFRLRKRKLEGDEDLYWLHNELVRWAERLYGFIDVAPVVEAVTRLRSLTRRVLLGPDGYGDQWFVCNFSEAKPSLRYSKYQWEGYLVKALFRRYREKRVEDVPHAYAIYHASLSDRFPYTALPSLGTVEGLTQVSAVGLGFTLSTVWTLCRDWPEIFTL